MEARRLLFAVGIAVGAIGLEERVVGVEVQAANMSELAMIRAKSERVITLFANWLDRFMVFLGCIELLVLSSHQL